MFVDNQSKTEKVLHMLDAYLFLGFEKHQPF